MSKTITVPVEFTVEEFEQLLADAEWEIDDPVKFNKHLRSEEFAQLLAADLKNTWKECNDMEDLEAVVDNLFNGAGCQSQLEFWDYEDI